MSKDVTKKDELKEAQLEVGRVLGKYKALLVVHTKDHAKDCLCIWCGELKRLLPGVAEKAGKV